MSSVPRPAGKIRPLDELAEALHSLRDEGKSVVQCHGVFDLLHFGHIRHFESARRFGDVLVVTVTPDRFVHKGPGRPVFNERLRAESIAALECVDFVAINEWPTAAETIALLRPAVYCKGSDYADRESDITRGIQVEEAAVQKVGGRIEFTTDVTFSSSELLNQYYGVYPEEARRFLEGFKIHHTPESVRKAFRLIADGHVDPNMFITADAPLESLPQVLGRMGQGGAGLKTAILPWGDES